MATTKENLARMLKIKNAAIKKQKEKIDKAIAEYNNAFDKLKTLQDRANALAELFELAHSEEFDKDAVGDINLYGWYPTENISICQEILTRNMSFVDSYTLNSNGDEWISLNDDDDSWHMGIIDYYQDNPVIVVYFYNGKFTIDYVPVEFEDMPIDKRYQIRTKALLAFVEDFPSFEQEINNLVEAMLNKQEAMQ